MWRLAMRSVVLLAVVAACGGGGDDGNGGTNPPPPTSTVASVEVSPASASLAVPETVQLTATPKDATGAPMSGKTVTWTTSASGVASVSSSGLVTSVAAGTATITATVEGRSGSAAITVTQVQGGPVIAKQEIGSAGGSLGTTDIGVTLPAGAFTTPQTVVLIRDTVATQPFAENAASPVYRIDGIPAGQTVQVRVRIRRTQPVTHGAAIAQGTPVVQADSMTVVEMGYRLTPATDSSGYLVATVPIRGRPAEWHPAVSAGALLQGPARAAGVTPRDFRAAAELSGLVGIRTATSAANHFKGWGFVRGTTTAAEVDRQLAKALPLMEQSYTTASGMGFLYDHRTAWPIDVYVMPLTYYGVYYSVAPFPWDPDLGYFALNSRWVDDPVELPATAIHEFFHFVQVRATLGWTWPNMSTSRWLNEATSTWIEEYHPALVGVYPSTVARDWKDSLYSGIDRDLQANAGYGKAPMIKFLASRKGRAAIGQMYADIKAGATPAAAFFLAFGEPSSTWWPALLRQHLENGLYPWDAANLVPGGAPLKYTLTPNLGLRSYELDNAHALSTMFVYLTRQRPNELRDDWFGPDYDMPVYLGANALGKGKVMAFRKTAGAAGRYTFLATGDTVRFPSALLSSRDTALLLITHVSPSAPYTGHTNLTWFVDLRLPNGDWHTTDVRDVRDGMQYACTPSGSSDSLDVKANVSQILALQAGAGSWVYKAGSNPEVYEWKARPGAADTLAQYRITTASTVTIKGNDSIVVQGTFTLDWLSSLMAGAPVTVPHLPVWLWVLVPVSAVPFAFRRRTRWMAPWAVVVSAVVLGACDVGQIAFGLSESYEFRFGDFRFMADSTTPDVVQMELRDGAGKTVVSSYRSEYWTYTTDEKGEKVDSTKHVCTGSGTSTYEVDMDVWRDGVEPPDAPMAVPRLSEVLGRPVPSAARIPPALRLRVRPN